MYSQNSTVSMLIHCNRYTQQTVYSTVFKLTWTRTKCNGDVLTLIYVSGVILAGLRCYVVHCVPFPVESPVTTPVPPTTNEQAPAPKSTLDLLVGHENQPESDSLMHREHHHQHHNHHHHNNHRKKRSSQGSHSEEA